MIERTMGRREAITAMGMGGMAAAAMGGTSSLLTANELGWDAASGEYTLPPLPYDFAALEPHIDAETMRIHHDRHHAGYVRGLNRAIERLEGIREGQVDAGLMKHWSSELAFHGAGHLNHTIFWRIMAPESAGGGGRPTGALASAIDRDFGSFERFAAHFKAASGSVEGSGWGWLVLEPVSGRLRVIQVEKHQNHFISGSVLLMGVDVWEHAYYLRYQNRRGDYVSAFLNVVNWPEVSRRYEAAMG